MGVGKAFEHSAGLTVGARFLVMAASLVVVVHGLRWASPILVPFTLAFFLVVLSLPLLLGLQARRVPPPLAILVTLLVDVAVVGLLLLIITRSVNEIVAALPRYTVEFQLLLASAVETVQGWGVPVSATMLTDLVRPDRVVDFVAGTVRGLFSAVSVILLVLLIMIFMLAEAAVFPTKLRAVLGSKDADLSRFVTIVQRVQSYLAIKTLVSLVTGMLVGVWVWLLGVDFPVFWGLIAFLFNYVPNIGSILASVPAMLLAMLQYGLGSAVLVGLGYAAINVVLGNLVEPHLQGRRLGLSTLVVVLSLVFWGWVWGPVGMLLSLPLTMIVKIVLENTRDFRWVAILLANKPPDEEAVEA